MHSFIERYIYRARNYVASKLQNQCRASWSGRCGQLSILGPPGHADCVRLNFSHACRPQPRISFEIGGFPWLL